jgi:hypothetical protein
LAITAIFSIVEDNVLGVCCDDPFAKTDPTIWNLPTKTLKPKDVIKIPAFGVPGDK